MINLRYHIVSIVAVFLALGIGVLMGSTIVDRALVDNLNGQLDGLEGSLERADAENAELQGELNRTAELQVALDDEGTQQLLRGRLTATAVLVVAVDGVNDTAVARLHATLVAAGASAPSPLWLTDKLRMEGADDAQELAAILGAAEAEPSRLRPALAARMALLLRRAGVGEVVPATTAPPESGVDGAAPATTAPGEPVPTTTPPVAGEAFRQAALEEWRALLRALQEAGFVRSDGTNAAEDLWGAAVVVVGGQGAALPDAQFAAPLATALAAAQARAVVAAETVGPAEEPGGPGVRGRFVGPMRADDWWREHGSTVDDLETFAGRAAVVLAVEDLGRGVVGHYGLGDDAQRLLPAPPP